MKATYNITNDKLKFWPEDRLPADQYERARRHGFVFWHGSKCFAAKWSPGAEDFVTELGGVIEADDAPDDVEARVSRFQNYASEAEKAAESAADYLNTRANTERRQQNAVNAIEKNASAAEHWQSRIQGAIRAAQYKEKPEVIARRIRGLEADRRRQLNRFTVYEPQPNAGQGPLEIWVGKGRGGCWATAEKIAAEKIRAERWIAHIDRRLEYENASLEAAGGAFDVLRPARKVAKQPKGPAKARNGATCEFLGAAGSRSGMRFSGPVDWWRLIIKVNRSTVEVLCPSNATDMNGNTGRTYYVRKLEAFEIVEVKTAAQVAAEMPELLKDWAAVQAIRKRNAEARERKAVAA